MRCRLRFHRWVDADTRPVRWLDHDEVHNGTIAYRRCADCGQLQRQDFWTNRYENVDQVNDTEPNPGFAPDLE
jgi:hypothetical protein